MCSPRIRMACRPHGQQVRFRYVPDSSSLLFYIRPSNSCNFVSKAQKCLPGYLLEGIRCLALNESALLDCRPRRAAISGCILICNFGLCIMRIRKLSNRKQKRFVCESGIDTLIMPSDEVCSSLIRALKPDKAIYVKAASVTSIRTARKIRYKTLVGRVHHGFERLS